jgi:hypothetical protein
MGLSFRFYDRCLALSAGSLLARISHLLLFLDVLLPHELILGEMSALAGVGRTVLACHVSKLV